MIKLPNIHKKYIFILLLGFTFFNTAFIACQSKDSLGNVIEDSEGNSVLFTVNGIADVDNIGVGKQAVLHSISNSNTEKDKVYVGGEGYEIEFTTGSDDHKSSSKFNFNKNKSAVAMTQGTGYRIMFYEVNGVNEIYYKSEGITAGTTAFSTKLPASKIFKWYAYSYNQANVPSLPSDVDNPVIPSRTDAPLLMAQGQVNSGPIGNPSQHIGITFVHKVAKVEAVFDARLVFASSITILNAQFNNLSLTAHNFGLKSGNVVGNSINTLNIPNNSNITFENIGPSGFESTVKRSTNAYYTSTAINSLKINVSEFSIIKYGTVPLVLITSLNQKNGTLNYSSALPRTRRALINLVDGGSIDGATWAEGNLYYDALAPEPFKYKFESPVLSGQIAACNHYWLWMSLKPRSITGGTLPTGSDIGDPCSKVYPAGAWRLPTSQDFTNLGPKSNRNSPLNGAVYFITSDGQRLNLHEAGWITSGNTTCTPSNTNDGHYWTSNEVNSTSAKALEMDQSWGGGDTQPTINKRYGLSIRCIRTY